MVSPAVNKVIDILTIIIIICIFGSVFYLSWRMMNGMEDFDNVFSAFQTVFVLIFGLMIVLIVMNLLRVFTSPRSAAPKSYSPSPLSYEYPQKCRNCGVDIANDPTYCPECGFKLKDDFYHR